MASTSETGHAKNVANFDELISFVKGYGTAYNPSKASLCLLELQNLSTRAKNAIDAHIIWQGQAMACPYNHHPIIW